MATVGALIDEFEEDEIVPEHEIKEILGAQLDSINSAGLFACHEQLKDAPNPGISIEGAGTVSFPLTDRDIGTILSSSGPVEAGNECHGLEISAQRARIANPSWNRLVLKVVSTISEQRGIDVVEKGIAAANTSLILYQPGSVIRPCSM
jgi:hypothetical protein